MWWLRADGARIAISTRKSSVLGFTGALLKPARHGKIRSPPTSAEPGANLSAMVQTTVEARQQLLDELAAATDEIGFALVSLGAAYEQLDEARADELEEALFRPVQLAYGRARRAHTEFAGRHGMAIREFNQRSPGLPSTGAKGFIDNAVVAVGKADTALATLQDSLLPVEVGDPELRSALAELRELVGAVGQRARDLVRVIGR